MAFIGNTSHVTSNESAGGNKCSDLRSRHASRHVRDARAVMHAGIAVHYVYSRDSSFSQSVWR